MASPLAGKRILCTGGTGFLGRHVVERLQTCQLGYLGYLLTPSSQRCDLRDPRPVDALFRQYQPDVVFHLAANCGGIGYNQANPGSLFYDNLMMGLNVVEACRLYRVEKLVCVGTTCSYPKHCPAPFREEDLWNGYPEETNAPYGVAKRALLTMCDAYRTQYGLQSVYLIPTNLYGPGDCFDPERSHVIPAMIRRFIEAREAKETSVTLWGSGMPTRDFLFVRDCADAIVRAAETCQYAGPVNLGSEREIEMQELARMLAELTRYRGKVLWDTMRPDGQPRRVLNSSKAWLSFGWRATTPLEAGLAETVAWYEQQRKEAA